MFTKSAIRLVLLLSSCQLGAQDAKPLPDLATSLTHTAAYCDKLSGSALHFVCNETVRQTTYYKMIYVSENLSYDIFPNVEPHHVTLRKFPTPRSESFRYSYLLLQEGAKLSENRALQETNGKTTLKQNASLSTHFKHQYIVFGPLIFSRAHQSHFDFRILGRDRLHDRDTLMLEAKVKPGCDEPFRSGTFWIDENDWTIHKIIQNQQNLSGFGELKNLTSRSGLEPCFAIGQEYDIVMNGIRFPSRAVLLEDYNMQNKDLLHVSRTDIEYNDYLFYKVDTAIDALAPGESKD